MCNPATLLAAYLFHEDHRLCRHVTSRYQSLVVPTILVIEDAPEQLRLVEHILKRDGFAVTTATDGLQAKEYIETGTPTDFILMDAMIPYMSGFELITLIRSNERWKEVPIVMLTSRSQSKDVVDALESGADEYITKPFAPKELIARLKRLTR
jgi:two-component system, OmpR family, phosphate regulon response regulator PhoB